MLKEHSQTTVQAETRSWWRRAHCIVLTLMLFLLLFALATGPARAALAEWPAYWQTRFAPGSAERSLLDQAFADLSAGKLQPPLAAQAENLLRPRLVSDSAAAAAANPPEAARGLALARAWMFLGELASARGDKAQCAQDEQQGLVWFERSIGVEAGEYGQALSSHANSWSDLGQLNKAIAFDTKALSIVEKAFGIDHVESTKIIDSLASKMLAQRQYVKVIPLLARALAISEKMNGSNHPDTLVRLNNLGLIHRDLGEYVLALPLFERALTISEKALGPLHSTTGIAVNNLALVHRDMGQYASALPLFERALTIAESNYGLEHPKTGLSLNNLALVRQDIGQYDLALPLLERALSISEAANGANHQDTALRINSLALVHREMGQYAVALPLFERALTICEKAHGPLHPTTGIVVNNLALVHRDMSQYALALPLLERALAIAESTYGPKHPRTGLGLNNLASLQQDMGQYGLALPLFERALAISKVTNGEKHPVTALRINNLALLHQAMGQYNLALPLFESALAITEANNEPNHPNIGLGLNNLAMLHRERGKYNSAIPLLERGLTIIESANGQNHPRTGMGLNNLALLYLGIDEFNSAAALFERALLVAEGSKSPELSWMTQSNLMALSSRSNSSNSKSPNTALAIWYGKQAVNTLQTVRGGLRDLNQEAQQSFLKKNERTYTYLANLLIEAGRLAEAEQVLDMLKEYELFQLLRSRSNSVAVPQLGFSGLEQQALAQRQQLASLGVKLSVELDALRKKQGPSASELRRIDELEAASAAWRSDYEKFLASLGQRFAAEGRKGAEQLSDQQRIRLQDNVAKDAAGSVGLHYSVSDEGVGIIVATPTASFGRFSAVKRKELDQQVKELRQAILRRADTRPAAQALWRMLIAPVLADLQASGAKTVVLSLTDNLRYLPFAALQNPEGRYLVQDFALSGWASAGRDVDAPATGAGAPRWQVAGLGVSKAHPGFDALPAVRGELESIVRTTGSPRGLLPGQITLDEAFGRPEFNAALRGPANVLHVASHFTFLPGNDLSSGLLLGTGERLGLAELRGKDFSRLDQLTLSACDTAMGGGVNQNGAEVEGLASIVLKEGKARSVMATLWKVADDSTAHLMRQFYTLRSQTQPLSRAQALRQAQLSLLEGRTNGATNAGNAKRAAASTVNRAASAGTVPADPNKPYAHPYFWAPFTLSGNWM